MENTAFWQHRMFWIAASVLMGALQAWDSGALQAGPGVLLLTIAGVLAPVAAIAASSDQRVWIAALVAGAAALTAARIVAPIPLNTLHLSLFVPALYVLFVARMLPRVGR